MADETANFDFDAMCALEKRLGAIEGSAPDILYEFYEPYLSSFSVKPGSVEVRVSLHSGVVRCDVIFSVL